MNTSISNVKSEPSLTWMAFNTVLQLTGLISTHMFYSLMLSKFDLDFSPVSFHLNFCILVFLAKW